jgi:glycerol-3-phosphate cytidylyltransferase-like family protein
MGGLQMEIVGSSKYVDSVTPQEDMDKFKMWEKLKFDAMFVGDDWYASEKWRELERQFNEAGVRIVFFLYTKGTSSTLLNQAPTLPRD